MRMVHRHTWRSPGACCPNSGRSWMARNSWENVATSHKAHKVKVDIHQENDHRWRTHRGGECLYHIKDGVAVAQMGRLGNLIALSIAVPGRGRSQEISDCAGGQTTKCINPRSQGKPTLRSFLGKRKHNDAQCHRSPAWIIQQDWKL